jgi:very-short-patch-repair endonuclease
VRDRRERALAKIAGRQRETWTLQQALECGFSRPAIRRRIQRVQWEEIAPRVYRLAHATPPDDRQLLSAQVRAFGGVASGQSAAALYGWMPFPRVPEITVDRAARRKSHRSVHITDALPPEDITSAQGIRATTPVRTLIDLGTWLPRDRFEDVFDQVLVSGMAEPRRIETRARQLAAPRRGGCGVVLALLAESHPELRRARNGWEAKALRAVGRLGLPPPRVNYRVRVGGRTRYIDLAWPEEMVAVELDGFVPHSNRAVFEDDRVRQNDLVEAGWEPYRVTWKAFTRNPRDAFRHVITALTRQSRVI